MDFQEGYDEKREKFLWIPKWSYGKLYVNPEVFKEK